MTNNTIKLGLLEFGYAEPSENPISILENVIRYCDIADALNFSRFWLTEHHNFYKNSPWSSPEFLLPVLLGRTEKIKVGSGGVLINYQNPYRLALNFKLLTNIFPNRVELGLANSHPADEHVRKLLAPERSTTELGEHFKNIVEVSKFYNDEVNSLIQDRILLPPFKGAFPDLFLLGSTFRNLDKALELRLNFCKSIIKDDDIAKEELEALDRYRVDFEAAYGTLPVICISLGFICTKKHQAAKNISRKINGESIKNEIIGSPEYIFDEILKISERFGTNNFVLKDISNDYKIKFKGIELIANEFSL